jgi:Rrf2 family transcriptional regulator, cysteine metabolism repressor
MTDIYIEEGGIEVMISNRCYYALKAVLELAKKEGSGLVTIAQIAGTQHIPARFLEAILIQLKKGGFARSVRGKEGGYALAKSAKTISVGDIVRIFEGPICSLSPSDDSRKSRRGDSPDPFSDIWARADSALASVIDKIHFADLAEKDRKASEGHANYVI